MSGRMNRLVSIFVGTLVLGACSSGSPDGSGGANAGGAAQDGSSGSGGSGGGSTCAAQGQSCDTIACCSGLTCCGPPLSVPDADFSGTCYQGCPVSDRNLKQAFKPIDPGEVLDRVAELPISTWSYKSEDPSVRHIGPMAQDFKAAFGVGSSDRTILQVDGDGVALAAIQALRERLIRLERQNAELERELKSLRAEIRK